MKTKKAKAITSAAIQELSLVFAQKDGVEYAPRNPAAKILAVKAGEKKPSLIDRLLEKAGWPVTQDVADGVDDDGDGADDYNELCSLLGTTYSDLQQAMWMNNDTARSAAVKIVLDEFKEKIEGMYAGKSTDKAGARHSAADKTRIDAMGDHAAKMQKAAGKMQEHADAMVDLHKELTAPKDDPKNGADKDSDAAADDVDASSSDKAKKKDNDDDAGDQYGDVEYADTANKKYPVDTKEHAKAAWSYINQEKNADKYDADELATIKSKIKAACKKFGVDISDDKAAPVDPAEEVDMTEDQLNAAIAKAAEAGAAAALVKAKVEIDALKAKIDATELAGSVVAEAAKKATAEAAAAVKAAEDKAKAAEAEAAAAKAAAKSVGADAFKPSAKSTATTPTGEPSRLQKAIAAHMAANPVSHVI